MPIGRRPAEETLEDILAELTGIRQIFEANNSNNNKNKKWQNNPNSNSINNVRNAVTGALSPDAMKEKTLTGVANAITSVGNAYLALVQGVLKIIKAEEKIKKATTIVSNVVTTLNGVLKANKEILKIKRLKGITDLFEALGKLTIKNVFAFWLYNKLITTKIMQNFVDGLTILAKSPKLSKVDFRGISMMFDSISDSVTKIAKIVGVFAIMIAIMGWKDIAIGFATIVGIILTLGGVFWLLGLGWAEKIKKGAETIKEIGKAITALTLAIGLLLVLVVSLKFLSAVFGGWNLNDVATGLEFLVGGVAIGLIVGLSYFLVFRKGVNGNFEKATEGIKNISIAIGLLILDLFGLMLLAKYQQEIPWNLLGQLGAMLLGVVISDLLLNAFSPKGNGKQAMYSIIGIGILIGLMVIDLLLLTLIVKIFKKEEINQAMSIMETFLNSLTVILGILAILAATIAISNVKLVKLASGDTRNSILEAIASQKNPIFQTLVGISLVILSISVSMWLMTEVVKNNSIDTLLLAFGIFAGFLLGFVGILVLLKFINLTKVNRGIVVLKAMEILCFGIIGMVAAFIVEAKQLQKLSWKAFGYFWAVAGSLLVAVGVIMAIMSSPVGGAIVAGAVVTMGVIGAALVVILEIAGLVNTFYLTVNKLKKWGVTSENFKNDKKLFFGLFKSIIHGALTTATFMWNEGTNGFLTKGAGLTMIATLIPILNRMSNVISAFAQAIIPIKQNGITGPTVNFNEETGQIEISGDGGDVGVFFSIFMALVKGVVQFADYIKAHNIGFKTSFVIRSLGKSIMPLIDACSKFTNMIIAFKNAKMPKAFDKDGNVIEWQTIDINDFKSAADVISEQFTTFLSRLIDNTENLNYWQAKCIKKLGEGLSPIMNSIGGFVDAILKLAVHQVYVGEEDYIDKDGNHQTRPKYVNVTDDMFLNSAVTVGLLFEIFLLNLLSTTQNLSVYQANIIKSLGEGLGPIMTSISSFIDAIMKFASGYIIIGEHTEEDKNGNKIIVKDWKQIDSDALKNAGENVGQVIADFINKLATKIKELDDADAWKPLKKSVEQINSLFTSLFGTIDKPGPISTLILIAGAMHNNKFPIGIKDGVIQFMDNPGGPGAINQASWAIGVILHTFVYTLSQYWSKHDDDFWEKLNKAATQTNTLITTLLGGDKSSLKLIINANEQVKKANIKNASNLIDAVFGKNFNEKIQSLSSTPTETIDKVASSYYNLMVQVTKLKQVTTTLNTQTTTLFKTFVEFDKKLATTHNARIKRINEVKTAIQGVANSLNNVNKNIERKIALTNEQNRLSALQPLQAMIGFVHGNIEAFGNVVRRGQEQTQHFVERIFERNTTNNSNSNVNNTSNDNRNIAYNGGNNSTIQFNSKVVFILPNGQQLEGFMTSEQT